jgi:hypothetical protein
MKRLLFLFACATAVMILLSACAASRLDADFGTSYKLAKINQVLNPDAEKNLEPVYGLDGIAVQYIMDKYYAGFKEKTTAPNYIFSVGGIGAGQ